MPGPKPAPRSEHGTHGRYKWDIKHGVEPCVDCRAANASVANRHRQNHLDEDRLKKRAVTKAFTRLRRMFPVEFEVLYQRELASERESEQARRHQNSAEQVPLHMHVEGMETDTPHPG